MRTLIFILVLFFLSFSFSSCEKESIENSTDVQDSLISQNRSFSGVTPDAHLEALFQLIDKDQIDFSIESVSNKSEIMSFFGFSESEFDQFVHNWTSFYDFTLENSWSPETTSDYVGNYFLEHFGVSQDSEGTVAAAAPCTNAYNNSILVAAGGLATCLGGTAGLGSIGCVAAYGIAVYAAEQAWCTCMDNYTSFEGC